MKFLLIVSLALLVSTQVRTESGQKSFDSTFNQINSLKGIELKIEAPYFGMYLPRPGSGIPFFFNFENERAISPSSSLILKAGINVTPGVFYEDTTFRYELDPGRKTEYKVLFCSFGFNLGMEPRWYWNYQKRAKEGKTRLNSGWFLSLPFEVNFPQVALLYGPTIRYKKANWITDQIILLYSLGISTGYRFSLTDRMYLESSLEIPVLGEWTKYGDSNTWWPIGIYPQLEIRLAYTFKNQKRQSEK
jgi:hypothetical protein